MNIGEEHSNESPDKIKSRGELQILVAQFEEHLENYKSADYNEATLRIDFLNKFFKVLGWDVTNEQGLPPSYREVVTEDSVQVEGRSKSPDYSFRKQNGTRLFFVEAKKPHVNISKHNDSAFQLRRYGWNADLIVSILTSFEYFAVYDCSIKPIQDDKSTYARLKLIHFTNYVNDFDYFWDTFSKQAVLAGSLRQFVSSKKSKKGTASVDKDFLESLDGWRIKLAKNINELNSYDEDQLNFIVQSIIDRIIFLRIAEDRDVEAYGLLNAAIEGKNFYKNLHSLFLRADSKYNSGLFKRDNFFEHVKISNQVLEKIVKGLYYPKSPYEFSVLPIEILGKAYEQFLGKQIKLTANNNIKIDDKPEVRKAGGVYYTPRYIVEFIVENTVGKLCENKNPKEVAQLRILDPASGSGSFLICAFEYLLNWHKNYFNKNKSKLSKSELVETLTPTGELTTKFKGRILLNSIYGVDIDANAVEVTKLSLLLKCMEGETKETVQAQFQLFHERLLPTLDENIKCGNSLIDFDVYSRFPDLSEDIKLKRKINAFNWKLGFKDIFKVGGFDVIIGNPPYIFTREQFEEIEKSYYTERYSASWEKKNTYFLFMERVLGLAKVTGLISFITPNSWLTVESAKLIRAKYLPILETVIDLNYCAFEKVSMEPAIFIVCHGNDSAVANVAKADSAEEFAVLKHIGINKDEWFANESRISIPASASDNKIIQSIWKNAVPLHKKFNVFTGLQAYEKGRGLPKQSAKDVVDRVFDYDHKFDKDTHKYLNGGDISRYTLTWSKTYLRWGPWLSQPRQFDMFESPRVLVREITGKFPHSIFSVYVSDVYINNKSIINIMHKNNDKEDLQVLEAILNSKITSFFYRSRGVKSSRKLFPKIVVKNLREFPYPRHIDTEVRKKIIELSTALRKLHQEIKKDDSPCNTTLQSRIEFYEEELNQLIYKVFGLKNYESELINKGGA